MPIMRGCCCFAKLINGSRATAAFSAATAIANIIIDIWMLVNLHYLDGILEDHEKEIWLPPGCIPFIYIELVVNIILFVLSLMLWVGINYGYDGKPKILAWIYGMIISRVFHLFLGIYVMVWIGRPRFDDVVFVVPEAIVVAIYWLLNTVIMTAGVLCVISYWQELMDYVYGKEKRTRYYSKLANIRSAALGEGSMTPRSYMMSQSLAASQPSLAYSQRGHPPQQQQYAKPQVFQGKPPSQAYQPRGPPPQQTQQYQYAPRGAPQQGYAPRGPPPQGYSQGGPPPQGYPPRGPPQQGPPRRGPPSQGYSPRGPPSAGPSPHGPPPAGFVYPPRGQAPPRYPSAPPQQGYSVTPRPQGLPQHMQQYRDAPPQRKY